MDEGLTKDEFRDAIPQFFAGFNVFYMLFAKHGGEIKPVGMAACHDQGYRIEPHAIWFPWATVRNRLESALNFLNKIRVMRLVVMFIPQKDIVLYEKLARYGVIQRRGTIGRFFEDGQFAAIFQTRD